MKFVMGRVRLFHVCLLVCVAVGFVCCSRTEPRIPFGFIELVYYPDQAAPVERFSFFVIAEDDDGLENLAELRLYHDSEGLEWTIDSEDWVHVEEEGKHWVGSRSIAMDGDKTLPRGQYRAVLYNKGGEQTERLFTFDAPVVPRFPYPVFNIEEERYTIDSKYPVSSFLVYDQQGVVIRTIPVEQAEGAVAELGLPGGARFLALWARDEEYRTAALTEALPLR